ncbi:hypothetical protein AB0469_26215 [Streptomyces sp. NPDC093801]|uniref:hypothetical protein n=1 Tax=Streptomyces sp. NPDC093801 TaxID=3155203 RepID=UPI00344D7D1B
MAGHTNDPAAAFSPVQVGDPTTVLVVGEPVADGELTGNGWLRPGEHDAVVQPHRTRRWLSLFFMV